MDNDQVQIKEKIRSFLEENMPRYMEIFRSMVDINSHTENAEGVGRLGEYTASLLAGLGFESEAVRSVNPLYGSHLVATLRGATDKVIGCVSHLDTVYTPEEEAENGFSWREEGGRIYGPGTIDIKGGTVVMLMMLEALRHAAPDLFSSAGWVLLFDASEETDSDDFGRLCRGRLEGALACLVFEAGIMRGSDWYVVTARKGRAEVRLTATGKGAHSGVNHRRGCNAVVQIADVIGKIHRITDYGNGVTVNIGLVSGGKQINRVPHYAEARCEVRAFSPDSMEKALSEIMKFKGYSSVASDDGGFSCTTGVEVVRQIQGWPGNGLTDGLLSCWEEAGRAMGVRVIPEKRGGISDGNFTWDMLPTIDGLGPAGGNPHSSEMSPNGDKEQEYAEISTFVPKALLNALAVMRLLDRE